MKERKKETNARKEGRKEKERDERGRKTVDRAGCDCARARVCVCACGGGFGRGKGKTGDVAEGEAGKEKRLWFFFPPARSLLLGAS